MAGAARRGKNMDAAERARRETLAVTLFLDGMEHHLVVARVRLSSIEVYAAQARAMVPFAEGPDAQIVGMLARGASMADAGAALKVSAHTVRAARERCRQAMIAAREAEAAAQRALVPAPDLRPGRAKALRLPDDWTHVQDGRLLASHGRYREIARLSEQWGVASTVLLARYHRLQGRAPLPRVGVAR